MSNVRYDCVTGCCSGVKSLFGVVVGGVWFAGGYGGNGGGGGGGGNDCLVGTVGNCDGITGRGDGRFVKGGGGGHISMS